MEIDRRADCAGTGASGPWILSLPEVIAALPDLTSPWTQRTLLQADQAARGQWYRCELEEWECLHRIVLPVHCHGKLQLVPPEGSTAAEAAAFLLRHQAEYLRRSPSCYRQIDRVDRQDNAPIVLMNRGVAEVMKRQEWCYERLVCKPGRVVHLDGLHRLVARAIWNAKESGLGLRKVTAYIAGLPPFEWLPAAPIRSAGDGP
ncbi:MAG TPA: DUF6309 family protein [Methylococcus sp.]|nr:DUF6309 family protein [Methylococcus sp.]